MCHGFLVELSEEEKLLSAGFIQLTAKGIVSRHCVQSPAHGFLESTMAVTLVTAFEAL